MARSRSPISMEPLKSSSFFLQLQQKGRILRPFLCGLALVMPTSLLAEQVQGLSFEFDSLSYSEATSIHSIGGRWQDNVGSGDTAFTLDRLYLGYNYGPFSIQYVLRYDYYYDYANDTAQLIYLTKNQLPLRPGERYELYIGSDKTSSKGFRYGYSDWLRDDFKISAFLSLLELTELEQGELQGSAAVVNSNDYDFSFYSDVAYEDDPLYDRDSEQVSGYGYSFDLMAYYQVNQDWDINLEVFDLLSRMKVEDAPFTTATATSNVKNFDENGYVVFDPVVTGFEGNKSYSFEFNTQTHLAIGYRLFDDDRIVVQHHEFDSVNFQELSYVQRFGDKALSWSLIPELNVLGVSLQTPFFQFTLKTDDLDYEEMKYLHLSFQLYLTLG